MIISANISGAKSLINALNDAKDIALKDTTGLKEGAEVIAEKMRENAPFDLGTLHGTINVSKIKTKSKGTYKYVTIGNHRADWPANTTYYPPYVEYGHAGPKSDSPKTPAHQYIRPALNAVADDVCNAMMNKIAEEALKQANK